MFQTAEAIAPKPQSKKYLSTARSRSRQLLLVLSTSIAVGLWVQTDQNPLHFTLLSLGLSFLVIEEALEVYVARTDFKEQRIEHRNRFGHWRGIKYSEVYVESRPGHSIVIFGDDLMERSLRFTIAKADGDLEAMLAFLRGRVPAERFLPTAQSQ